MAMSSGVRQAVGLAVGWLLVAATSAFGVLRFAELKDATRGLTGLAAADPAYTAASGGSPRQWQLGRSPPSGRVVELRAGAFGHYRAQAEINGRPVEVMVDSGASVVVLSHDDAERAGLNIRAQDYTQRVSTANGATRVAPMLLDRVSIGNITVRNVEAAVSEPGKLGQSLLGMTFLGRLQRVDMRAGVLILQE
jgi:aspartyl protease family protein